MEKEKETLEEEADGGGDDESDTSTKVNLVVRTSSQIRKFMNEGFGED